MWSSSMPPTNPLRSLTLTEPPHRFRSLAHDALASVVVFLVALPLCLGIALASFPESFEKHLFAGLISGVVGGLVVGVLSGSQTSVSGPAAGLTAVVAAQLVALGSFRAFLLAVMLAGLIQIALGLARAGSLATRVPTSVIKGLLAAIGVILVLKQLPHVVGHDPVSEGALAHLEPDETADTLPQWLMRLGDFHPGAAAVGLLSVLILIGWDRVKPLNRWLIPSALMVVLIGVGVQILLREAGDAWAIDASLRVQVPVAESVEEFLSFLQWPDFSLGGWAAVYLSALTIAVVASLETLLNLEAVDKLDPRRRVSPPNRELIAQGVGNTLCGLIGGLPVTSVIARSSVNISAGAQTKLSAILHGLLLLLCVAFLPDWLNEIPLSCLAAILLVTGVKLASPRLFYRQWCEGWAQFLPFVATVCGIVLTDLLVGVLIGLGVHGLGSVIRRYRFPPGEKPAGSPPVGREGRDPAL